MISLEDDGVTVEEGSLSEQNDENTGDDQDMQSIHEEVLSHTNIKCTEYNDGFRAKLKEPAQNCFMQRSAGCCFTLWVCGMATTPLADSATKWMSGDVDSTTLRSTEPLRWTEDEDHLDNTLRISR